MNLSMVEKTFLWVVKIGLWAIPILPLYISGGMLFPFITGKNFFFRIIIDLIFAFWAGLAVARPEFRPRLTPLFKAATIFIVILFLADLLSPNPYRAFFSNYERMEGFMMLFHLYLYFVMLVSVFKTKMDWLIFFHVTLFTSLVVAFIGILQKFGLRVSLQGGYRVDSTIGNPAYLGAYLMFHAWLLLLLLKEFWQKYWIRIFYTLSLVFELVILYFTATRGAILAITVGSIIFLAFLVFFWPRIYPQNVRGRNVVATFLILMVLFPIGIWVARDTKFVRSQQILHRIAAVSLEDTTTKSRFSIWQMSFQGALERPMLGWGQENYYLVFQKYFDPKLWSSEPWFDRSHNIIFDWLIHAGFLGLVSYLSMIAVALWSIIRMMRQNTLPLWTGAVVALVFITHFLQNFFVFDNLNTYILFFGFLAYTQFLEAVPSAPVFGPRRTYYGFLIASIFLVAVLIGGYFMHVKPMRASGALIRALTLHQQQAPLAEIQQAFTTALSYHTFGNTEIREQLGNAARDILNNNRYTPQERTVFVPFAIEELTKEVGRPAKDIKHMIFLASIMDRAGDINPAYVAQAEAILKEAIQLSPTKQILYFELAQFYLSQNRVNESIEALRRTVYLEPSYQQAVVNLFIVGHLAGRQDIITEIGPLVKLEQLDENSLQRLASIYQQAGDLAKAKDAYARLVELNPEHAQYRAAAAPLFAQFGEYDRAIEEARAAAKLDSQLSSEVEIFIRQVEERKNAR